MENAQYSGLRLIIIKFAYCVSPKVINIDL